MGEDARWVCHTCKTVCPRGGRPIFKTIPRYLTLQEVRVYRAAITRISSVFDTGDFADIAIVFLDQLSVWLKRHQGHNIHIGSDYSTDMMDLEEYHNETVGGVVDKLTRINSQLATVGIIERDSVQQIKSTILKHGSDADAAAKELYSRFSTREI